MSGSISASLQILWRHLVPDHHKSFDFSPLDLDFCLKVLTLQIEACTRRRMSQQ